MRVLWFTNTPSNYLYGTNAYNGGGWISSLEKELVKQENIELGVAFILNGHPKRVEGKGVFYYPINNPYVGSIKGRIKKYVTSRESKERYFINAYLNVIEDFRPEIINVFGTEQNFGLVSKYITIPVIIHIQGILVPCQTAFYPPSYNRFDYLFSTWSPIQIYRRWRGIIQFIRNAEREKAIFQCNRHFIGRTAWDKNLTSIYSPNATYDYCSEILRDVFYHNQKRHIPNHLIITTTISSPLYKGFDVILKCAKILKYQMNMNFEWRVYGNINPRLQEKKEGIRSDNVNVKLMGVAKAEVLQSAITESTLYVHPSYIDNSPNSVCEAQILGCTVVGQFVGGIPSLIKNYKTGVLVPANDPFQMACAIRILSADKQLNEDLGHQAAKVARKRHDKVLIIKDLLNIYNKYLSDNHEFINKCEFFKV